MMLRFAANAIVLIAFLGLLYMVQAVAPSVESYLFPVLLDQRPTVERIAGNGVRFSLVLRKNRFCAIDRINWNIVDVKSDLEAHAPITVRAVSTGSEVEARGGAPYPIGYLLNGPFEATLPESLSGADMIVGHIEYRCHPFWTTPQTYGPFPIPEAAPK